jgi:hypothetical protein
MYNIAGELAKELRTQANPVRHPPAQTAEQFSPMCDLEQLADLIILNSRVFIEEG